MLASPPFYYYKIYTEHVEVIWQHLLNPQLAATALKNGRCTRRR
jgi:hypothetical protein